MSTPCRVLKCGSCEITQYYGGNTNHLGIDVVGKGYTLDTIKAHTAGKVVYLQTGHKNNKGSSGNASYGNMVKLDHGNGWFTLYAHMDKVYVSNGQQVSAGQEIGYMGNTGNSYGGHLHFEVWKNNARTNPLNYLNANLFDNVVSTVKRDENKDQLKVLVDDLRIRKGTATNQTILGLAKQNGIYNYYEVKEANGYTWYKLADNQWIAYQKGWLEIYLKKAPINEETILEYNKTINELKTKNDALKQEIEAIKKDNTTLINENKKIDSLNNTISELNNKVEELNKEVQTHKDKVVLLEKENLVLREDNEGYKVFIAPAFGRYYINLDKDQSLSYKKI